MTFDIVVLGCAVVGLYGCAYLQCRLNRDLLKIMELLRQRVKNLEERLSPGSPSGLDSEGNEEW